MNEEQEEQLKLLNLKEAIENATKNIERVFVMEVSFDNQLSF
ncbi:MAG: hypothetical protein WC934_06215 [Acidithiobacillus sp.]|jgi:hypothetical protein